MKKIARSTEEIRKAIPQFRIGRDEMNLVEFPFATLSDRSDGRTVLEYETEEFDRALKGYVRRRLTVTGDPLHGLPTAPDEEVYLGLLQMTKLYNEFTSPLVYFTRSQLLRLMGWKNKDSSYHRLTLALHRLSGARLSYHHLWRDNAQKQWRTTGAFAIVESFELRDSRNSGTGGAFSEVRSEIRWGSVLFESFEASYLKRLDYTTVKKLGGVARRLYRYLDKHFHPPHRMQLQFDLHDLAHQHVGIASTMDATQIRQRYLQPAALELEAHGFLTKMPEKERFQRLGRGKWQVTFERQAERSSSRHRRKTQGMVRDRAPEKSLRSNRPELRIFRAPKTSPPTP